MGARKRRAKKKRPDRKPPLLLMVSLIILAGLAGIIVLIIPMDSERISLGRIHFESFRDKPPPPPPPMCGSSKKGLANYSMPLVAIIIDDVGYHRRLDKEFIELPHKLSFAFLPYGPFTQKYAALAHRLGKDVLIHIPMEPAEHDVNPGPGTLRTSMTPEAIIQTLSNDLDLVPFAIGANNHMGSRFTQDPEAMDLVLMELKRRGLFFIDSRTTTKTVAYREAISLGIPALERHVFLDYADGPEIVEHSLDRLLKIAGERGYAVAIGHPFQNSLEVLKKHLPIMQKEVKIVPVSHLIGLREEVCKNEVR